MKFISSKDRGGIEIVGLPYDGTACFRPGARFGPEGIRFFSRNLEEFSFKLKKSLESLEFVDKGDVELPSQPEGMVEAVFEGVKEIEVPVILGGEHSVTFPVVKALKERYGSLTVVQFDAHADLRDTYTGTKFSHACVMRRVLELGCELIQVGIRSGTKEELELMENESRITYLKEVSELPELLKKRKNENFYFTVDIDFFDPAYAPGTGTPEPCGATPVEFFSAIYKLPPVNVVGFDVVEVSPPYDPSGITQMLGAKIVRELMLKFWG